MVVLTLVEEDFTGRHMLKMPTNPVVLLCFCFMLKLPFNIDIVGINQYIFCVVWEGLYLETSVIYDLSPFFKLWKTWAQELKFISTRFGKGK